MDPALDIVGLLKLLKDRSVSLRQKAAKSLAQAGPEDAKRVPQLVGALETALEDANKYVRVSAAFALGKLGAAGAQGIKELVTLLGDPHRDVRLAAVVALGDLGPAAKRAAGALSGLAANDPVPAVRARAAEVLAKLGE